MPPAVDVVRNGSETRARGSYPSGTGIARREQREAAVIGKPVADQPEFLCPAGETTAAGLAPTPDLLDDAR